MSNTNSASEQVYQSQKTKHPSEEEKHSKNTLGLHNNKSVD